MVRLAAYVAASLCLWTSACLWADANAFPNINPNGINALDQGYFDRLDAKPSPSPAIDEAPPGNVNTDTMQKAKDSCHQYRDKEDMPAYRSCYQEYIQRATQSLENGRDEVIEKDQIPERNTESKDFIQDQKVLPLDK